jgi:hypothetical protein
MFDKCMLQRSRTACLFLLALAFWQVPSTAHGQTFSWNGPVVGSTNWSAGSWSPGTPPVGGGTGVGLFLTGSGGPYTTVNDLGNPFVANSINFGPFGGSSNGSVTISSAASNSLQLGGAAAVFGSPMTGGQTPADARVIFSSPLSLNTGSVTLGSSNLGSISITGIISSTGSAPVTIGGNSALQNWSFVTLSGASTFTGPVTHTGNVGIGNGTAPGAAGNNVTVAGGSVVPTAAVSVASNFSLGGGSFHIHRAGTTGITLQFTAAVPEPIAQLTGGAGVAGVLVFYRRRKAGTVIR